jgi:hypothetical protein
MTGMVGSGMISVGGGGGGSVGGITVGGILVGGTIVGNTEVGGTEVRVGLKRVDVARTVGEAKTRVLVAVGKGSCVRCVTVTGKVHVGVGVRVTVGVAVGMVDVTVGGSVGVRVGAVDVGKGPSSAWEVRARAVLVLLTPRSAAKSLAGSLKANQKYKIRPSRRAVSPAARRSIGWFKMFTCNNSFPQNNKKIISVRFDADVSLKMSRRKSNERSWRPALQLRNTPRAFRPMGTGGVSVLVA